MQRGTGKELPVGSNKAIIFQQVADLAEHLAADYGVGIAKGIVDEGAVERAAQWKILDLSIIGIPGQMWTKKYL